jgi:hypothetical protein
MENIEIQQVMGLGADHATHRSLVPKFKYDGGNPGAFMRDFPTVIAAYGLGRVYQWDEDLELDEESQKKNTLAILVLRQYLTDKVLKIVMVNQPQRASTIYKSLHNIFLTHDARTKVQVNRELQLCEMGLGESMDDFVARINDLMNEAEMLGERYSQEARMIMVATRLREPWRKLANDKMDLDPDLTYEKLIQFLVMRQRGDPEDRRSSEAYMASHGRAGRGYGGQGNGGRSRGVQARGRGGRISQGVEKRVPANVCANCGEVGHWKRFCDKQKCYRCGKMGHLSYECTAGRGVRDMARISVVDGFEQRNE